MLGSHADAFFAAHSRERVIASQPNQFGSSYRVPDRDRLSGLGDGTTTPGIMDTVTSTLTSMFAPKPAAPTATPGGTVAPAPSKWPLYLAIAGGALALLFVLKSRK